MRAINTTYANEVVYNWKDKEKVLALALAHAHTMRKFTDESDVIEFLGKLYDRSTQAEDFLHESVEYFDELTEEIEEPQSA